MHKKKEKKVVVFMILKDSYYDPVIDNNYEINDCFLCIYERILTENAIKRTRRWESERFSLTIGNLD